MPFTKRQEKLFHARGIRHSHDYIYLAKKLKTENFQIDKLKGHKNTFIVTRLSKQKRTIPIGKNTYVIS